MKALVASFGILLSASLTLPGCAHAPPILPDDSLVYFILDVEDLPGGLVKAVFETADKTWKVGSAWNPIRERPKTVVAYVTVPHDRPIYLSEIHADNSGILTGHRYEMYVLTPQESPIRLARTSVKAGLRYGGALKFKLLDRGLFKANKFSLERCPRCPSEKEALALLAKIANDGTGDALLNTNDYLAKIQAKLQGPK